MPLPSPAPLVTTPFRWPNPVNSPRSVSGGRHPGKRLIGNRSRFHGPGTDAFIVEVQGANAVADHFFGYGALWDSFARQLLDVTADIGMEEARRLVHVRTGATRASINKDPGVWAKPNVGEWSIRYGPTTFYAPFLEYGTIRSAPYPFMIPSGDLAEAVFVPAVLSVLNILVTGQLGSGGGGGGGIAGGANRVIGDPRIQGSFSALRSFLYTTEKFLGDIAVFGGRGFIGPARNSMLHLARALGDVSSVMNHTISTRVSNRLRGRVTGHLIGFGAHSLSYERVYSSFPGGTGGHRIYQRVAGKFGTIGFNLNPYHILP